jgi:membrane protease YdiL (CAAX protease family)
MDIAAGDSLTPPETQIGGQRIDWSAKDVLFGLLWFLGLFIVAPLIVTAPVAIAFGSSSDEFFASALVLAAVAEAGIAAIAAWYTFGRHGGGLARLGLRPPGWPTVGWAVATFVAALAFSLAWAGIINVFDIDALKSKCDDQIPKEILNNNALLALAGVSVVGFAPLCEEMFFRGFVFPGLARSWGIAAGIAGSALLFSIAHVSPSLHKTFVPILAIGLVFAFSYWRSGNLFSTVLAHLGFNVLSFVALNVESCP